jgi:hypothetical protein
MTEETKGAGHPFDKQYAIERDIQLKGAKDPDNFKMLDGRTLTEVRNDLREQQDAEYKKELQMVAARTREQSAAELQKGKDLEMTSNGSIVDVTEPVPSDKKISLATSRTTLADIEAGTIQPPRERVSEPTTTEPAPSA